MDPRDKAKAFLKIAEQFKLGHLVTESFHPKTHKLSQLVKKDVTEALALLQEVDKDALSFMQEKEKILWHMAQDIQATLSSGHRVFMCGCGATGRLSLVLETLFHQVKGESSQVISFMAGGDYALIKSVESFEDKVEFGEKQLLELGFGPNDLLLSPTEGGETPFVIGATNLAAKHSSRSPYFLYCNPDELLMNIDRSRAVIENPKIKKVNLAVGPMAISGSTRMQASTVLMLAIGVGLLYSHKDEQEFHLFYQDFLKRLTQTDYRQFKGLTQLEARLYQNKKFLNYLADPHLAISILTDTTERSPTFSLKPFENRVDLETHHSLSYLFVPQGKKSADAWNKLLWRSPRALEWPELDHRIGLEKILGFDISLSGIKNRDDQIATVDFLVNYGKGAVTFTCESEQVKFLWGEDPLFNHLMTKMLLNAHSTLVMGLMNRYEGNVMTWVRASNNKLIDRAARYVLQLLKQQGKTATYEDVVLKIFEENESPEEGPVVIRVLERY